MRGALILLALIAAPAAAQRNETADRAAIHKLLVDYGATLDARDFDGFGRLFAKDGVYLGGGPSGEMKGGAAAAAGMKAIFAANALGFKAPNFHIFFNEVVTFDGPDKAHATSMSLYMVPDEKNRPNAALMARYRDDLVRENSAWKFARRAVEGLIPTTGRP
ncbi:MAG: nuclear transport factor 2 family protein [Sphingobium sp.]|nr:nuclear transport factor 2 family protein [Sphingobium sp.]